MSEHIERVVTMLALIPRYPRKVTVGDLVARLQERGFEVGNRRMIERNLQELAASPHFPLQCDEHKPAGWSWAQGAQMIDIPCMDAHTALTFGLAERFLEPMLPHSTRRFLDPHFAKARAVLEGLRSHHLADWPSKIAILPKGQPLKTPEVDDGVLEVVYAALLEDRRFEARYRRRGAEAAKQYVVDALGLVFRNDQIYLVGRVVGHDEPIQFLLHRMEQATLRDEPRQVPEGFDLDRYVRQGGFRYGDRIEEIALCVRLSRAAALQLYETPLSDDQTITEQGDDLLVRASVRSDWQLSWWLLSFGDHAEVLEPAWLREQFTATAARMAARYASPASAS
ncbi:MAG: WYL domain-containing protein [Pseudomonadota bacterium]